MEFKCYICEKELTVSESFIDPERPWRILCTAHRALIRSYLIRCKECHQLVTGRFPVCPCGYEEAT